MRFDKNRIRSMLTALFAIAATLSLIMTSGWQMADSKAYGQNRVNDIQGDSPFADLDIKGYGFSGRNVYVEVYGIAGGTLADHHNEAIAYVVAIKTDEGETQTWAIDSHEAQHGDVGVGVEWHAHRVHLGDNPKTKATEDGNCVNEVDEVLHATMQDQKAIFEEMKIRGNSGEMRTVNAIEILGATTVLLEVQVEDPDNPPKNTPCIALVADTFDTA